MTKTKIEIAKEMIEGNETELASLEIREMYLNRKVIMDDKPAYKYELGKLQSDIKETKEWIKFLEEKVKEKFK